MEEVQTIVRMLNAPPVEFGISVLDFCQKDPMQLRQLLYQVLSVILPPQKIDDAPEVKTSWMMELLHILNYRPSIDEISLRDGITHGITDVIYQLLTWLLSQITTLKKRAYLARFLVDVEIPAELLLEEDMNMMHTQYIGLREQFKITHRHLDTLYRTERTPNEVKEQVESLEMERHNLQSNIVKVKSKLQNVEKLEGMLEVVGLLKTQQLEESNLAEALKEQRHTLTNVSANHHKVTSKLQQMQTLTACPNALAVLQKISHENSILKYNKKEKLSKELEAKQLHLRALQEGSARPNISDEIASIQVKLLEVNEKMRMLRRKHGFEKLHHDADVSKGEILQWQQAQMGVITTNKKRLALDKLDSLTICRDKLLKEIEQKKVAIEEVKVTVLRGEDFRQYVDQLRSKSATYKKMKKEIDDLASEYEVSLKTQQLLEQQKAFTPELGTQEGLISAEKNNTLKNLKVITMVDTLVKEMKCKLAPHVKELKLLRANLQELEVEHAEKKQHYTDMRALFERKVLKQEGDLSASSRELEMDTERLKENFATVDRLQASLLQLSMEKQDGSISSKLSSKIEQQQMLMNNLHQKQQKLKEMEHQNLVQMAMMKDLSILLAAKLNLYSSGSKPAIFSTVTSLESVDTNIEPRS